MTIILTPEQRADIGYAFKVTCATHPGMVRNLNEDSVLALKRPAGYGQNAALLVVADGMGGHKAGEIASRLAVACIKQSLAWLIDVPQTRTDGSVSGPMPPGMLPLADIGDDQEDADRYPPLSYLERYLREAVRAANRVIYRYALSNQTEAGNLGTTLTCALIMGNEAIIANVGDSRTYLLRDSALRQITDDHSYVGHLVRLGNISAEEIYEHPQRHLITRSLGHGHEVEVDVWTTEIYPNDRLLLCSDGLWEMVRKEEEIITMMKRDDIEESSELLIKLANHYGGNDNITVAIAEVNAK